MPKTILVVDDEAMLLRSAKRALERQGYAVRTADTVHQALAILATKGAAIDLLVTDNNLENPNEGVMLIAILDQLGPPVPGILYSGRPLDQILADCRERGTDAAAVRHFVQKPDHRELLRLVRSILGDEPPAS